MALLLDKMEIRLSKDSEGNLKIHACVVKKSSDDESLKSYYEKEMSVSEQDASDLSDQFDAIEAALKTEDSLA